ncbi:retrovirus-related pol polyprotein from transposon TNT 1-94 [Tanacetum coccineum]
MQNFLKNDIVWESKKEILSLPFPQKQIPVIQSCQRDPKAPTLSLINQDLLYLKKGNSGPENIVLSLHKFLAVIFPDDDIEERTSRWVDKCVKKFNPYAQYNVKHWKNPHAKIFYIKRKKEPGKPKEEVYSNSKIVKVGDYAETGLLWSLSVFIRSTLIWERVHDFQLGEDNALNSTENSKKEERVMRHQEVHKFCDATLKRVLEGLKSYNNDVKHDQSTTATTSSHRHSTSAAIKSLFTNTNSLLRRTKSFSAAKNEPLSFDTLEPHVALSSLFVNDQQIQDVTDVNVNDESSHIAEQSTEIEEIEEELDAIDESLKKMKQHIDGTQFKKHSKSKIWSVSVLSKKWQNWRKKNKKPNEHVLPVVDKSIASQYRETQSEIADYGFEGIPLVEPGRLGGYMIGRSFPSFRLWLTDVDTLFVVVPQGVGLGTRVPVNEADDGLKDDLVLGVGSDESKLATSVVSNANVSHASVECNYGRNERLRVPSIGDERELARDSNANSLRDDCSEPFELRFGDGDDEDDKFNRLNVVARSYLGSWEQSETNQKVFRSNSSVSWRNSSVDMKKSNSEMNRLANGKNRRVGGDEFVLERNRSARHSPNHADSGLLRFYLTPLRGSRRSKPTSNSNNSIARNTLRL